MERENLRCKYGEIGEIEKVSTSWERNTQVTAIAQYRNTSLFLFE
jgi:hypothetical protein